MLITGYTVIILIISLLLENIYREYFTTVLRLMFTEEYSYLITSFFTVVFTLYLSLRYMGFAYEIQVSRLLASISLAAIAISLYFTSRINTEQSTHLMGLSFAILTISMLTLVFKPITPSDVIPLVIFFLLVPVPTSIVDQVTPGLSRIIGRIAAYVTGVRLVESPGMTIIEVETSSGIYSFSVEAACTGIITISSILALLPLLAYYITASHENPLRKVFILSISYLIGLSIGFIGNVLRVVVIILIARYYSVDLAMNLFHYSPSIIYSSISVIAIYTLINRMSRIHAVIPRPLKSSSDIKLKASLGYVAGVMVLLITLTSITYSMIIVTEASIRKSENSTMIEVDNWKTFMENPSSLLLSRDIGISGVFYDAFLTRISGSLASYRVNLRYRDKFYYGFLEVVDLPSRLHTLQYCMSVQGFTIKSSWSEERSGVRLGYILMEKDNRDYILGYTLIPILIKDPLSEQLIYVRYSLFREYRERRDIDDVGIALVESFNLKLDELSEVGNVYYELSSLIGSISLITLLSLFIYIALIYTYRKIHSK